jgi:osmotically-inducible protein OsmY
MISDNQLQRDVQDELRDEPSVDASQIGVAARGGIVTLTGSVPSYAEKLAAEEATKRVYGVSGVADEIQVRLGDGSVRDDTDIAKAALQALRWNTLVPDEQIQVTVDKGWVTLEGALDWQYQRAAAESAVRALTGVKGVINSVRIKPRALVKPADVKQKIFEAFRRNAELEARRIGVDAREGKVVLHGNVHDWAEAAEAQRAAWSVPGVAEVENRLFVIS